MAKKRVSASKISQRKAHNNFYKNNVPNPFKSFRVKNPISNLRWSTNAVFFGLLVILILIGALSGETYYSGNLITGSAISDITGAQTRTGIAPVVDMLKDLIRGIFGPDGIIAIIFINLTGTTTWLAAVAIFMILSGFFYLGLRKTLLHGEEHKKLATFIAIGLGLLSLGITISGQNVVAWFSNLFESAIVLLVIIVLGFMLWILTMKGMAHSSRVWGEAHAAAAERIMERRGQLSQREGKREEKTLRKQQREFNSLLAYKSANYRAAKTNAEKKKIDFEFRSDAAKLCPNLDQGWMNREWQKAIK